MIGFLLEFMRFANALIQNILTNLTGRLWASVSVGISVMAPDAPGSSSHAHRLQANAGGNFAWGAGRLSEPLSLNDF